MKRLFDTDINPSNADFLMNNFLQNTRGGRKRYKRMTFDQKMKNAFDKNLSTNKEFKVEKINRMLSAKKDARACTSTPLSAKKVALEIITSNHYNLSLAGFALITTLFVTLRFVISLVRQDKTFFVN